MGGGGGSTPEPKKFVSPPIDNSPATNPIPNFFAPQPRQVPSPYEVMAALPQQAPQNPFAQFGPVPAPVQFSAPQRQVIQAPAPTPAQVVQAVQAVAQERPSTMTKEEYLRRGGRLGKGGGS